MNKLLITLIVVHCYSVFICINRELYDVKLGFAGGILKFLEVIAVCFYFSSVITCLSYYSFWMYNLTESSLTRYVAVDDKEAHKVLLFHQPSCLKDKTIIKSWSGGILDWLICEVIINITYAITFLILMAKSRIFAIGIDNTYQFQPTFLSFLVNKIIVNIPFDFHQKKYKTKEKTKERFVNRKKVIDIDGVRLAL